MSFWALRLRRARAWGISASVVEFRQVWSLWAPDWTQFSAACTPFGCNLLYPRLIAKSLNNISSLTPLSFSIWILAHKLVNMHIASANSAHDLVSLFDFNMNSFWAKLIHAFRFSQEHDFQILAFWIIVDEILNCQICLVGFVSIIDFGRTCFQLFFSFVLCHKSRKQRILRCLELTQHVWLRLLRIYQFLFQRQDPLFILLIISLQLFSVSIAFNQQVVILLYFLLILLYSLRMFFNQFL